MSAAASETGQIRDPSTEKGWRDAAEGELPDMAGFQTGVNAAASVLSVATGGFCEAGPSKQIKYLCPRSTLNTA